LGLGRKASVNPASEPVVFKSVGDDGLDEIRGRGKNPTVDMGWMLLFALELDGLVKSPKNGLSCHSGESRNPGKQALLDPGFRRGDGFDDFLRNA